MRDSRGEMQARKSPFPIIMDLKECRKIIPPETKKNHVRAKSKGTPVPDKAAVLKRHITTLELNYMVRAQQLLAAETYF